MSVFGVSCLREREPRGGMDMRVLVIASLLIIASEMLHIGEGRGALFGVGSRQAVICQGSAYGPGPESPVVVVGHGGSGKFLTVQAAVNSIAHQNSKWVVIDIRPGIYREKVTVTEKHCLVFNGAGPYRTTLTFAATAGLTGGTNNSATFTLSANHIIVRGITIQNTAYVPNPGAARAQAVAMYVNGDYNAVYNCRILSGQDTLYDHAGLHYFRDTYIQGSIDFIFGNGQSVYVDCHLYSIATSSGTITAQRRRTSEETTGFIFVGCLIDGFGLATTWLGRPWGPYSRVYFIECTMSSVVKSEGWTTWPGETYENTVDYGQYKCSGVGADEGGRVKWGTNGQNVRELTMSEINTGFSTQDFIKSSSWL